MTVPVPDQLEYAYAADGVTAVFAYPKRFLQSNELVVLIRSATGVDTTQALGVAYTVIGAGDSNGGTVTFGAAPPVGTTVVIYRETEAKQTVDLENNQRNDAQAVETQLDRIVMVSQELRVTSERILQTAPGADPIPIGNFVIVNENGFAVAGGSAADISDAQSNAAAAAIAASDAMDAAQRAETAASGVEAPVSYEAQVLTDEQKEQARTNIGAVSADDISFTGVVWNAKAIGEPFPLMTDLDGVDPPPIDNPDYRYIELTAGLTDSGEYNEGCLTDESTSGSAPLVQSTAEISLADSPMLGATVRLINTEERFLRAAASPGAAQNDQMQQITGSANISPGIVQGGLGAISGSGNASRASGTAVFDTTTFNFNSANSPNARTGTETRSKNLGVKYFMRIK